MKRFNIKKYSIMLAVAGVFLTLVGVTYALYSYLGLGSKYIVISSNGVTFSYLESKTGLSLTDAIPKPDEIGKTDSNYFEFYIRANSNDTIKIPYYITTRKTDSSSNIDDAIKLYLTRVSENGNEEEVALVKFSDLKQYTNSGIDLSKYVEKLLYNTEVPIGKSRYRETYRLRMWIDLDTNFVESKYNDATFSVKINVYARGKVNNQIYADYNGRLHVAGSKLMNQYNEEFRVVGASGAGLGDSTSYDDPHYGEYNAESLATLKSWGANGFRIFVTANQQWMASYIGNEDRYIAGLKKVIDAAIENDLYIIVNWDPADNNYQGLTEKALECLTRVANMYPDDPHIIYEIWNEPTPINTWDDVREHANTLIPAIREISPHAVILVGSPWGDKDLSGPISNPLDYENIMYTNHCYVGDTFSSKFVDTTIQAIETGLPLFVTEWGPTGLGMQEVLDPHGKLLLNFLNINELSYMAFPFGSVIKGHVAEPFGIVYRGEWQNSLPDSILRANGIFMKYGFTTPVTITDSVMRENLASTNASAHTYRSNEWKDKIVSIEFKNKINIPSDAVVSWDLSIFQDKTIYGYLTNTDEEGKYKLTIAANGKIYAPWNCNYLFADLPNLKTIDFTNFDTTYVKDMQYMFRGDTSLQSLDLSGFNTKYLTSITHMFDGCKSIASIDFTGWTPKLENISGAFMGCYYLTSLDLSGFNVEKVTSVASLFDNTPRLTTVNVSTWKTGKLTKATNLFKQNRALIEVDISGFDFSSDTAVTYALYDVRAGATITVKDQTAIDILGPTSTNEVNLVIK